MSFGYAKHLDPARNKAAVARRKVQFHASLLPTQATNLDITMQRLKGSLVKAPPEAIICRPEMAERLGYNPERYCKEPKPGAIRHHLIQYNKARGIGYLVSGLLYGILTVAVAGLVALAYLGLKSAGIAP